MGEINQLTIAERLGISRATVSRCFTNHPGINPVTRARVFQVAAELGYAHLEKRTSGTSKGRARHTPAQTTFGVLICSEEDEYFRGEYQNPSEQILAGVTECAHLNEVKIEVHLINPKARSLHDPSFMRIDKMRRRWSGVLLVYPFPDELLDQLSAILPMVSLVEQHRQIGFDCVDADHYKGISAAIDHLADLGHRRIGFYTRRYPVEASWSYRRYAAFMEKMVRLKLKVSSDDIINVFPAPELTDERSYDRAAKRTRDGVTAWVCAADHQAYDLVRGLERRGFNVPADVSVTGFDGIEPPAGCRRLGTTQIPFREIGTMGTQRLVERVRKRFGSAQHVLIDCAFVPGETTAPPPNP